MSATHLHSPATSDRHKNAAEANQVAAFAFDAFLDDKNVVPNSSMPATSPMPPIKLSDIPCDDQDDLASNDENEYPVHNLSAAPLSHTKSLHSPVPRYAQPTASSLRRVEETRQKFCDQQEKAATSTPAALRRTSSHYIARSSLAAFDDDAPLPRYMQPTSSSSRRVAETRRALAETQVGAARSSFGRGALSRRPSVSPLAADDGEVPRYAMPTASSLRRVAETQRARGHAHGSGGGHVRGGAMNAMRASRSPLLARSPVFRSRGAQRWASGGAHGDEQEDAPVCRDFVPNPRPAYLDGGIDLPDIKLTVKAADALALRGEGGCRNGYGYGRRANAPHPPTHQRPPPGCTVPRPFALHSVEQHEMSQARLEARSKLEAEEDRQRRQFRATQLNDAILRGATFKVVPGEPQYTDPVDLLPHAQERSERTLAFEARQRERVEQMERVREMNAQLRKEQDEEDIRKEYEATRFRANKVPDSHYRPHRLGRAASSSSFGLRSGSSSREGSVSRAGGEQSAVGGAVFHETSTTRGSGKLRRAVSSYVRHSDSSAAFDDRQEMSTPRSEEKGNVSADAASEHGAPEGQRNSATKSSSSAGSSGSRFGLSLQGLRKSFSPLLGSTSPES